MQEKKTKQDRFMCAPPQKKMNMARSLATHVNCLIIWLHHCMDGRIRTCIRTKTFSSTNLHFAAIVTVLYQKVNKGESKHDYFGSFLWNECMTATGFVAVLQSTGKRLHTTISHR